MENSTPKKQWSTERLDALIFDLDGVITQTAAVHMKAWQQMFESYLKQYRDKTGRDIALYNGKQDYLKYIDGIPRYDGVRNLLESRDIHLPYGSPDDKPGEETICGLGNRKNQLFLELLEEGGVHVFEDTIKKIKQWRRQGLKTAVISSSKNCKPILETANIEQFFDTRVDGVVSAELDIPGKPAPDIFLRAADELRTTPARSAIFEDAISGVQAGKAGEFEYVVGVARHGSESDLYENGANLVIHNFEELG